MKKTKNILLLIGLALYAVAQLLSLLLMLSNYSTAGMLGVGGAPARFIFHSLLYWVILMCVMGVCPALLLARNLRQKVSKVLPIVTIVITVLMMMVLLISSLANPIPQYLIMSSVGVLDTYGTLLFQYLENGGLCYLLGGGCVIVGCIVTLCDNKKKVEETQ